MRVDFRPEKDAINLQKHRVSLKVAESLNWEEALVWRDDRFDYDEIRMIALAPDTNTLYFVAFLEEDDVYWIISLRRALRPEIEYYVKNI